MDENAAATVAWRLSEKDRRRLVHPLSNVRRWRAATRDQGAHADDRVKAAAAAWRRFVSLMEALPPDQAAPLWRDVQRQAAAHLANSAITLHR